MKNKRIRLLICIFFLFFVFVLIRGCNYYTEENFEEKLVGGLQDKNVNMRYFLRKIIASYF
jgi:hypothetical protein